MPQNIKYVIKYKLDGEQRFDFAVMPDNSEEQARLALAFRLEAEGLVFFPGFAPGWGMSARRLNITPPEPVAQGIMSRLMGSTTASIDSPNAQPNGA